MGGVFFTFFFIVAHPKYFLLCLLLHRHIVLLMLSVAVCKNRPMKNATNYSWKISFLSLHVRTIHSHLLLIYSYSNLTLSIIFWPNLCYSHTNMCTCTNGTKLREKKIVEANKKNSVQGVQSVLNLFETFHFKCWIFKFSWVPYEMFCMCVRPFFQCFILYTIS